MPHSAETTLAETLGIRYRIEVERVNGHDINYLLAGEGPPLILLHGINIGWGQWYPNISALAEHFTVYALDLPCAGASDFIDHELITLERDFVGTVDAFIVKKDLIGAHLVGHSFGGWVALRVAGRGANNIGKVVAVCPLGLSDHLPRKFWPITIAPILSLLANVLLRPTKSNVEKIIRTMLAPGSCLTEEFLEYYFQSVDRKGIRAHPFYFMHLCTDPLRMKDELRTTLQQAHLSNPTLILLGEKDPLLPVSRQIGARSLPNATVRVLPNAGHVPGIESSALFNEAVTQYLLL